MNLHHQRAKSHLLGLPVILDLQLVHRIDPAKVAQPKVVKQFSQVFQGLGIIGEEYHIKLREDAKPYSLYVPRIVLIPLSRVLYRIFHQRGEIVANNNNLKLGGSGGMLPQEIF